MRTIFRRPAQAAWAVSRRAVVRPVRSHRIWLDHPAGWRVAAQVAEPPHPRGGLLLVPGLGGDHRTFHRWHGLLHVQEAVAAGWSTLSFDPSGRGRSGGTDDFGGPFHRDDVLAGLTWLSQRAGPLVIVAASLGIAATAAALVDPRCPRVERWLDWEGPSDRHTITAFGRIRRVAMGHAIEDDAFWLQREAMRQVARAGVPYRRFQSRQDHAQPGLRRHMWQMLHAARGLPFFQLNDHAPNTVPVLPELPPGGLRSAHAWLMDDLAPDG